jgi:hypothetical protein
LARENQFCTEDFMRLPPRAATTFSHPMRARNLPLPAVIVDLPRMDGFIADKNFIKILIPAGNPK